MRSTFYLVRLLLVSVAGWLASNSATPSSYLREENQVLREQLGAKTPPPERRSASALGGQGEMLGWARLLREIATIVAPGTLLAWNRGLIAKYDRSKLRGPGRLLE